MFKVAQILDEFSIIINAGFTQGIEKGDVFQVYAPGTSVKSPDGLSSIQWDNVKAEVVAVEVQERLAMCKNRDTYCKRKIDATEALETLKEPLAVILGLLSPEFSHRPLKIDPSQATPIEFSDKTIRVGDNVRKIVNPIEDAKKKHQLGKIAMGD
ncbi:MAG: hypothetical protein LBO03_04425 [Acidaminococcales bacterium]|jgi:hypothetical protein|nr:hypothetical protein [Acidaminococcales bacterium]